MKIRDLFVENNFVLSFEVFPPAGNGNVENLFSVIDELVKLEPDFFSVTYGAGGTT